MVSVWVFDVFAAVVLAGTALLGARGAATNVAAEPCYVLNAALDAALDVGPSEAGTQLRCTRLLAIRRSVPASDLGAEGAGYRRAQSVLHPRQHAQRRRCVPYAPET